MTSPKLTVIIPYREDQPIMHPPQGDETIWMDSGLPIGQQRIEGSLRASHKWLVHVDADGDYPEDYIRRVKAAIASEKYPVGFWCQREGRPWSTQGEAGLVIRKNFFLNRIKNFVSNHRVDVAYLFRDLPINREIVYAHHLNMSERNVLVYVGMICLGAVLIYASVR